MFREFFTQYEPQIVAGVGAFTAVAFIALVVLYSCLLRRVRRLHVLLRGASHPTLQDTLEEYHRFLVTVEKRLDEIAAWQKATERTLQTCVRTPSVLRFNAFPEVGSDLSFALALVDGQADGVVLSSLYGRSESRTYAKPIRKGRSDYHLTEEEKAVLDRALRRPATGAS